MKQALPCLALLAACNAGPLQWSDAQTWSVTEQNIRDCAESPSNTGACDAANANSREPRTRVVSRQALDAGFGACVVTVRPDDTIEPRTCVITHTVAHRDGMRRHDIRAVPMSAIVTRESWYVNVRVMWRMTGTVRELEGQPREEMINGTFASDSTFRPVR